MIRGQVIGQVWATRKAPGLDGRRLLLVAMRRDGHAETGFEDRVVVAIDTLDAGAGDEVAVSFGSGARNVIEPGPANRAILADAAISLVVDGES